MATRDIMNTNICGCPANAPHVVDIAYEQGPHEVSFFLQRLTYRPRIYIGTEEITSLKLISLIDVVPGSTFISRLLSPPFWHHHIKAVHSPK